MASQFRNLVFEGGGVKGIAYAGAVKVLDKKKILKDIVRVAGTSAGAITAALIALGATWQDVKDIVGSTKFNTFMDDSMGVVRDTKRLIEEFGWYKGDAFSHWMQKQIYTLVNKPDFTFGQLAEKVKNDNTNKFKDLFIVGTNLTLQEALVFNAENTPDTPIWEAVRISMSIPLFFAAVKEGKLVWVDGGLSWNYPIDIFDDLEFISQKDQKAQKKPFFKPGYKTTYDDNHVYNKQTLGFRVDTSDEIKAEKEGWRVPPKEIDKFTDYMGVLVSYVMNMANKVHLHQNDWHRTVFIDADGVGTTEFNLSEDKIEKLVENGENGANLYFDWFEEKTNKPDNRV